MKTKDPQRKPSALVSSSAMVLLVLLMFLNFILGDNSVPIVYILVICSIFASAISMVYLKIPYEDLDLAIRKAIDSAMPAILIIFVIGSLIAAWIMAGIVPMFVYYGLAIINPTYFLFIACLMCCIVSLAIGSSWSTAGTVGLALMGIGETMGVPAGMTAGAVISGSYFGDKMSPMSDTTNLAPAMVGIDVITHIKHMLFTSGPAIFLSLVGFIIIGLFNQGETVDAARIEEIRSIVSANFNVSPLLLCVPVVLLVLVVRGMTAMPVLVISLLLSIVAIPVFQWDLLTSMQGNVSLVGTYTSVIGILANGFSIESGDAMIDRLFSRGGMVNMAGVNLIVIAAMVFGGVMEGSGMLAKLTESVLKLVKGTGSLVVATISTCVFINVTASNQTMALIIPARMFAKAFRGFKLHPKNLSRCVEDGGTVTAPLVPWNTNAIYMSGVLGASTGEYFFFTLFCLFSPLVSIVLGFTGKTMEPLEEEKKVDEPTQEAVLKS
jgi:NhaC family Na+:H+ antiporter